MARTVRISYNVGSPVVARTINFPYFAYRYQPQNPRVVTANKSVSGVVETLTVRADSTLEFAIRNLLNRDAAHISIKRKMRQWEQWAMAGEAWTLALDSSDTVLTTLTNSPAVNALVLSLTSVAGIVAGRNYVLRNEVDLEVVRVESIASLDVTIAEPLNYAYFAGDRFRSEHYWPARLKDGQPVIIEQGVLFWDAELRFEEDLSEL